MQDKKEKLITKNNIYSIFFKKWKKYKTIIIIVTLLFSFLFVFKFIICQWTKHIEIIKTEIDQLEIDLDELSTLIEIEENKCDSLRIELEELMAKHISDKDKVLSLKRLIAFKEFKIKVLEELRTSLEERLYLACEKFTSKSTNQKSIQFYQTNKRFIINTSNIYEYYSDQIKNINSAFRQAEDSLFKTQRKMKYLKDQQKKLNKQKLSQNLKRKKRGPTAYIGIPIDSQNKQIELLENKEAFQELEKNFYKDYMSFLEIQLKLSKQLIEPFKLDSLINSLKFQNNCQ